MEYYVYAYIRKTNGIPYYIGKGKGSRCIDRHPGVSVPKDHSKIILMEQNLTNLEEGKDQDIQLWPQKEDLKK
jgi:hypothetical protein